MTRHYIFDEYDWKNYRNFGGNFIPTHRILKVYFTQLKTLIEKQRNKKRLKTEKISVELDETQFKMLLDGLERASNHEELQFNHDMNEKLISDAFHEFGKYKEKSRDKGYRAACKVIGIAPGKRPSKISFIEVADSYLDLYNKNKSMESRYKAIFLIADKAKTTADYIVKLLKNAKKAKRELYSEMKLPRWPINNPKYECLIPPER